jgi:hypothetical protein
VADGLFAKLASVGGDTEFPTAFLMRGRNRSGTKQPLEKLHTSPPRNRPASFRVRALKSSALPLRQRVAGDAPLGARRARSASRAFGVRAGSVVRSPASGEKRRRGGALHDASDRGRWHPTLRELLECGGPPPLSMEESRAGEIERAVWRLGKSKRQGEARPWKRLTSGFHRGWKGRSTRSPLTQDGIPLRATVLSDPLVIRRFVPIGNGQ